MYTRFDFYFKIDPYDEYTFLFKIIECFRILVDDVQQKINEFL